MPRQSSFADLDYNHKKRRMHREIFLSEMGGVYGATSRMDAKVDGEMDDALARCAVTSQRDWAVILGANCNWDNKPFKRLPNISIFYNRQRKQERLSYLSPA